MGDEAGCDRQGRGGCVCPSYPLRKRRSGGFPAFHGGAASESQGRFFLQPWIISMGLKGGSRPGAKPRTKSKFCRLNITDHNSYEQPREIRQPHLGIDGRQRQRKVTLGGRQQSTLSNRRHSQFHPSTTVSPQNCSKTVAQLCPMEIHHADPCSRTVVDRAKSLHALSHAAPSVPSPDLFFSIVLSFFYFFFRFSTNFLWGGPVSLQSLSSSAMAIPVNGRTMVNCGCNTCPVHRRHATMSFRFKKI